MRWLRMLFFALLSLYLGLHGPASARQSDSGSGIGYPSVAAALDALKARNGVNISVQGGWTIVSDPTDDALWSFAPSDHPAFPAAVKRRAVELDGNTFIDMRALCQASKLACDKLMAEFAALNDKIRANVQGRAKTSQAQWSPSEQQKANALSTLSRFQLATDEARYQDAYEMFTVGMKAVLTFDRFVSNEREFQAQSGGTPVRADKRTTWYKDPPRATVSGVFAAFNIRCSYRKIDVCEEVIILHEERDGDFRVMRQERTVMDKENEQRLRASQQKSTGA
jgi:Protein of unknown function (DUF4019)